MTNATEHSRSPGHLRRGTFLPANNAFRNDLRTSTALQISSTPAADVMNGVEVAVFELNAST